MTFPVPLLQRFASYIEVAPNGCWHWTGTLSRAGYGVISAAPEVGRRRARQLKAFRVSFELFGGVVEDGAPLDHVCHSFDPTCPGGLCAHRRCVNPAHLEPVTNAENSQRAALRRTHCVNGHALTPENTRPRKPGTVQRTCITCVRDNSRRFKERRQLARARTASAPASSPSADGPASIAAGLDGVSGRVPVPPRQDGGSTSQAKGGTA